MAEGRALTALGAWVEERTARAPAALRQRVLEHVAVTRSTGNAPADLARAAHRSLAGVLSAPGDRTVALDLLAADGLITLALLRQAEDDPSSLVAFARSLTELPAPA
ncbi:MAG TPA: hypothetical protein VFT04_03515 [Gemmatimonadales bacterium]|nr:hypothetical protein [Gemmatimonadales bacterium]